MTSSPSKPARIFGLKDIFTSINALGGVVAIAFCIEGKALYAGYALLVGYVLGDSLDGFVARLTNTGNQFGAQFDAASDYLAQCIAPAGIVYLAYRDASFYAAVALASVLVLAGTIRHALFAVVPNRYPMAYFGMPRTVSSFLVIAFVNSAYIPAHLPGWRWVGAVLLVFLAVANLLPIPFRTHRGRKLKTWVKPFIAAYFVTTCITLVLRPRYVFDLTLVWMVAYSSASWLEMERSERAAFWDEARRWRAEIRAAR
ncbi:MAG: CDP-alcohol phosphatidyltransferase family protein [Deltaproteobacteria bacterium]|nr:CDP-alcohol phosphatidyltransferase family protein [Deltaproteobacteria bacterium]